MRLATLTAALLFAAPSAFACGMRAPMKEVNIAVLMDEIDATPAAVEVVAVAEPTKNTAKAEKPASLIPEVQEAPKAPAKPTPQNAPAPDRQT